MTDDVIRIKTEFEVGESVPGVVYRGRAGEDLLPIANATQEQVRQTAIRLRESVAAKRAEIDAAVEDIEESLRAIVELEHYLDHWDNMPEVRSG